MVALAKGGKAMSVGLATLLGFHRLSEAVTLTIHLENRAMVSQAVEERGSHPLALEYLAPLAEREVAGHEDAPALVAVAEYPEE